MKRLREIKTIKTIDLDTKKEFINSYEVNYIIKNWEELTKEEKKIEIEKHSENIYEMYQDYVYSCYKDDLEYIKIKFKDIEFNTIYMDSNSQGAWVDSIDKFNFYKSIEIYGETIEIYDINFHIRRYIEEITEEDLYINYIDNEKMEKIENTKKYKEFIKETINYINNWVNEINSACEYLIKNEYYTPYDLENNEDKDFLDNYFSDNEFIYYN